MLKIPSRSFSTALRSAAGDRPWRRGEPKKADVISRQQIPGVKHVIAIASGKGGVGKSTTAVNVACAFSAMDLKVGLLDLDVFGPSLPTLLGLKHEQPHVDDKGMIVPLSKFNIDSMSMGFLVPESHAMVWRGPMVMSAVDQLLYKVDWSGHDVLVVDLPPGTGDVHLSLVQKVPLTGAVLVTTPQDVALADVRRGATQFRKTSVPVLGIVQNMSIFTCPHCNESTHIFGKDGAYKVAAELDSEVVSDIPLHTAIEKSADKGTPVVIADPTGPQSIAYMKLAERLWGIVDERGGAPKAPAFVVD